MQNTILLITGITGLIGAITGLASILITYLNYSRDNYNIKVKALKGMKTFSPGQKDDKKTYLIITATNIGRRPITVNKAAFVGLTYQGAGVSASSLMGKPNNLEEGKSIDYLIEEDELDYSDISHVVVYDSMGNEHRFYLTPWYIRFYYWFLHITYVKRKPVKAPQRKT